MTVRNYKREAQQLEQLKRELFVPKDTNNLVSSLAILSLEEKQMMLKYISTLVQNEKKNSRELSENLVASCVLRKSMKPKKR